MAASNDGDQDDTTADTGATGSGTSAGTATGSGAGTGTGAATDPVQAFASLVAQDLWGAMKAGASATSAGAGAAGLPPVLSTTA